MCICNKGYRGCDYDDEMAGLCSPDDPTKPQCLPNKCECDPANGESLNAFPEINKPAIGASCWADKRGGCQRMCNPEDCNTANPVYLGANASKECAGVGKGILGSGCCVSSECCGPADPAKNIWDKWEPVPVDFIVFKRSKKNRHFFAQTTWNPPKESGITNGCRKLWSKAPACEDLPAEQKGKVACDSGMPWGISNIGGSDGCSGFCRAVALPKSLPFNGTGLKHCNNPFDFDREVAELTIVDLNYQFSTLAGGKLNTFKMGDYKVVSDDTHSTSLGSFDELIEMAEGNGKPGVPNGHDLLYKLDGNTDEADVLYPKPGRIVNWIAATEIRTLDACYGESCVAQMLIGTTFPSQSVNPKKKKGAAVLMASEVQRRGHRYAHEIAHVVGFGHGKYTDPTKISPLNTCETQLMGGGSFGPGCKTPEYGGAPEAPFTFTAGLGDCPDDNWERVGCYPSIFAKWRADRKAGHPGDDPPHDKPDAGEGGEGKEAAEEEDASGMDHEKAKPDLSALEKARERKHARMQRQRATADVFVKCDQIRAEHGPEFLQKVLKSGAQCK